MAALLERCGEPVQCAQPSCLFLSPPASFRTLRPFLSIPTAITNYRSQLRWEGVAKCLKRGAG